MGDIVSTEPISRAVREQYAGATIVWVARKPFKDIVGTFPAVDKVVTVICLTEWMLLLGTGLCETVLDLHVSDHYCTKCMAQLHKSGFAEKVTYETYYDYGNLLTVACLCAGIPPIVDAPVLRVDRGAAHRVNLLRLPADFIVVHCQSNDQKRNWPDAKWNKLFVCIAGTFGNTIVEIGLKPVLAAVEIGPVVDLCGKLSIVETAEVIRRARLFVGVDSGPAHLANAVGTPGVLLFGEFRSWHNHMPFSGAYQTGDGADFVRTNGPLRDLPVDAVARAVANRLGRSRPSVAGGPM